LPAFSLEMQVMPVRFPPGRARLVIRPAANGIARDHDEGYRVRGVLGRFDRLIARHKDDVRFGAGQVGSKDR